jgi:hypothetical protein
LVNGSEILLPAELLDERDVRQASAIEPKALFALLPQPGVDRIGARVHLVRQEERNINRYDV